MIFRIDDKVIHKTSGDLGVVVNIRLDCSYVKYKYLISMTCRYTGRKFYLSYGQDEMSKFFNHLQRPGRYKIL